MPGGSSSNGNGNNDPFQNCLLSTGLCCFKAQSNTKIQVLEFQIKQRQKKFGVDYMTHIENNASPQTLKMCLKQAQDEIAELQKEIDEIDNEIDNKERETAAKKNELGSGGGGGGGGGSSSSPVATATGGGGGGSGTNNNNSNRRPNNATNNNKKKKPNAISSKPPPSSAFGHGNGNGKRDPITGKPEITRKADGKVSKSAANQHHKNSTSTSGGSGADAAAGNNLRGNSTPNTNLPGDAKKWKCKEYKFSGSTSYVDIGKQEDIKGKSITAGISNFKSNPLKYYAMMYQTSMLDWPSNKQDYKYGTFVGEKRGKPNNKSIFIQTSKKHPCRRKLTPTSYFSPFFSFHSNFPNV